ncbi:hypothetical protein [Spiroplasma endosymbiont of Nebria brevicollis]|uniref:hypothetical protein n=1 Tax=Spiroplasma endosymbiont of Nebria brevicollis TaxID=3066284 RepID=UPI00313BEF5C
MKSLLKVVTILSLTLSSTVNIIACDQSHAKDNPNIPPTNPDISFDISNLDSINHKLVVYETTRYKDFNNDILNSKELLMLKPKLNGTIKIQYFEKFDNRDITSLLIGPMEVKVVVTITNDTFYFGKTNPLELDLVQGKMDLSQHLTSLNYLLGKITVTPGETYNYLTSQIINAQEFLALRPHLEQYIIEYYDKPNGNSIINNQQNVGSIWVVITATTSPEDRFYQGSTKPLKINLNKTLLNKEITELDGPSRVPMNFNKFFYDWNQLIMFSQQVYNLKTKLVRGYQIHYYDKPNGKDITNQNQDRIKFYVVITDADNDPVYQGSTNFIPVSTGKINISEYLSILEISSKKLFVNTNKRYSDLDSQIRNDWYIKNLHIPIKTNFQIHYFKDKEQYFEITNDYQFANTFYITITTANDDPIY